MTREHGTEKQLRREQRRSGSVLPLVVVAGIAVFGMAALATDVGHVWAARSELQAATDAAALAAAVNMVNSTNTAFTQAAAEAAADTLGTANRADRNPVSIPSGNLTFGLWTLPSGPLLPPPVPGDPNSYSGVTVQANLSKTQNQPVTTVLARVLGRTEFEIGAQATAFLGWQGTWPPGEVDLPVAIDCCAITQPNSDCGINNGSGTFNCNDITVPPLNQCLLADGVTPATCLEFFATPDQNACWTEFDGQSSSVSVPGLTDIVNSGNSQQVGEEPVYLDNGTKTPVIQDIQDKFLGNGVWTSKPQGVDNHPTVTPPGPPDSPGPGEPDSWVVSLPVVACQTQDHCAGGSPAAIVGAVCFEIREVEIKGSNKRIKGNFICDPNHALYSQCGISGAGPAPGNFGGPRAERAVLVQ